MRGLRLYFISVISFFEKQIRIKIGQSTEYVCGLLFYLLA